MRLLICGDRYWWDKIMIERNIIALKPSVIIEGDARGADRLAGEIGKELGIPVLKFPAKWLTYGNAAGPIRNEQMLTEGKPDLVLAFHDDIENSKGTKHMVSISQKAGINTLVLGHHTNGNSTL